jgi:hypothetical protein
MSLTTFRQRKVYEAAAARYSALLANTRDPTRRQMLEEMIARELDAAARLDSMPASAANDEDRRL